MMLVSTRFSKYPKGGKLDPATQLDDVSEDFKFRFPEINKAAGYDPNDHSFENKGKDIFWGLQAGIWSANKRDSVRFNPVWERLEQFLGSDQYKGLENLSDIERHNIDKFEDAFEGMSTKEGNLLKRHIRDTSNKPPPDISSVSEGQQTFFDNLKNVTNKEIANILSTDFSDLKDSNIFKKIQKAFQLKPENVSVRDALKINDFFKSDEGIYKYPNVYIGAHDALVNKEQGGKIRTKFSKGGKLAASESTKVNQNLPIFNEDIVIPKGPLTKRHDFEGNFLSKAASGGWRRDAYEGLGDLYRYFGGDKLKHDVLYNSKYRPTNSKDKQASYIAIKDDTFRNEILQKYNDVFNKKDFSAPQDYPTRNSTKINDNTYAVDMTKRGSRGSAVGRLFISKGKDEKGDYVSYYDVFDRKSGKVGQDDWKFLNATKPFEIYDRIYLDEEGNPKQEQSNNSDLSQLLQRQGGKMRTKFSKDGKVRTMLSEKKRVPVNDLHPFAKGGSLEGTDTKDLGTFRPTEFGYLEGDPDALESYGDITRDEFDTFQNDPTQIPELRNKINDAGWQNVIGAFQDDPTLRGLSAGNVKLPFGTGDRITGRYQGNVPELSSIAPRASRFRGANINPQPISTSPEQAPAASNKVNAYNYSKGRPYSGIEKLGRRLFADGGAIEPGLDKQGFVLPRKEPEGNIPLRSVGPLPGIPTPDQTIPSDNTQVQQNRPTFLEGSLGQLQYVDERFGLSPELSDEFNQGVVNAAYNPYSVNFHESLQKSAGRQLKRKCGGKLSKFSKFK